MVEIIQEYKQRTVAGAAGVGEIVRHSSRDLRRARKRKECLIRELQESGLSGMEGRWDCRV